MATKLKSLTSNMIVKTIAFLTAVASLTLAVAFAASIVRTHGSSEPVLFPTYRESSIFTGQWNEVVQSASDILSTYKSEAYIRGGNTITIEQLRGRMGSNSKYYKTALELEEPANNADLSANGQAMVDFEQTLTAQGLAAKQQAEQDIMQADLQHFFYSLDVLNRSPYLYYYITDGDIAYCSNTDNASIDFYQAQPCYFIYDLGRVQQSTAEDGVHRFQSSFTRLLNPSAHRIYLALDTKYFQQQEANWQQTRQEIYGAFITALICLGVFILSVGLSMWCTGRHPDGFRLHGADRIFTDSLLLIGIIGGIALIVSTGELIFSTGAPAFIYLSLVAVGTAIELSILLSLVRQLKNHTLLRHTLIATICRWFYHILRLFLNQRSATKKTIIIVISYSLLCALSIFVFPVFLALLIFGIWYIFKKCQSFQAVADGAKRIRAGELTHKIAIPETGALQSLADDINAISDGLEASISNELKSERYKTELITNVSHDIRTPLTSIITYVDLLKKEGGNSENAPKYIDVLEKKAARLKTLTDDLFEAAKATSGNINPELGTVDVCALIQQAMGELGGKIAASGLDFKVGTPEALYVTADGKLLWRVIQNLMSNVFKYAMPGSRVYLDVYDKGEQMQLVMKNISAYELNNVQPEELLQRFKRGDESRHTEGSGLGLAIAQSLIEAQHGTFQLEIDGDLFKVSLTLWKASAEPETDTAAAK